MDGISIDGVELRHFDGPIGVEVRGLDLSGAVGTRDLIVDLLRERAVVVVKDQEDLTEDELAAFAQQFGPLAVSWYDEYRHATRDDILYVSNVVVDGEVIGTTGTGELEWHANYSFAPQVALVTMLQAIEIPPAGGNTHFLSMYHAYDSLPDNLRARVQGLQAHRATKGVSGTKEYTAEVDAKAPEVVRSVVYTNPLTGRTTLLDPGWRTWVAFVGLDQPEGRALRDELYEYATQEEFHYEHTWLKGDLVIWDNVGCMHRRDAFDPGSRRLLRLIDVLEAVPSGFDPRERTATASAGDAS